MYLRLNFSWKSKALNLWHPQLFTSYKGKCCSNFSIRRCYFLKVLCYLQSERFEPLFYKINTCLKKTTFCIELQAEQIFSVNIWYTYFSILGMAFVVPFLSYFQKLQHLVVKKIWTNFCCIVLLYLWAQKACLRFLKPYFKLEILIFLSFVVFF